MPNYKYQSEINLACSNNCPPDNLIDFQGYAFRIVKSDPANDVSFIPQAIEKPGGRFNSVSDKNHCRYHALSFQTKKGALINQIDNFSNNLRKRIGHLVAKVPIAHSDGKATNMTGHFGFFEHEETKFELKSNTIVHQWMPQE